ncbi:MAG TPA: hypothetical protein VE619_03270 [Nitrososphaeraceae archaeon]|nr:hypothetical protein [Nitrososphaeraceae archaeon]
MLRTQQMMRKNLIIESVDDIVGYFTQLGNHRSMFMVLLLVIEIGIFSLDISTITINAQSYPSTASGSNHSNHTGSITGTSNNNNNNNNSSNETRMGICVIGVRSPCNGDSSQAK